jgi:hypothetical protein
MFINVGKSIDMTNSGGKTKSQGKTAQRIDDRNEFEIRGLSRK